MLVLELTKEEAESILRAHSIARCETSRGAVSRRICEQIAEKWPDLRAQYNIGSEIGACYVSTEQLGSRATHPWILSVETWDGPERTEECFAAPEVNGGKESEPFVTALGQQSALTVLLPRSASDSLREALLAALNEANLMYSKMDNKLVHMARSIVLDKWYRLIHEGRVSYDGFKKEWVGP